MEMTHATTKTTEKRKYILRRETTRRKTRVTTSVEEFKHTAAATKAVEEKKNSTPELVLSLSLSSHIVMNTERCNPTGVEQCVARVYSDGTMFSI